MKSTGMTLILAVSIVVVVPTITQARSRTGDDLATRVNVLEEKLAFLTTTGTTMTIAGANLQVVNGLGDTDTTNGLGNVIIGYNELRGIGDDRTGSHMLVSGMGNNYSSYGGIVVGNTNETSGAWSCVSGGRDNIASGDNSSVSGGRGNEASDLGTSILGGRDNMATNVHATVSGGANNEASGTVSSVSGGRLNEASGDRAAVSGGLRNLASGDNASVSGGRLNVASNQSTSVSGGDSRSAGTPFRWRAGSLTEQN